MYIYVVACEFSQHCLSAQVRRLVIGTVRDWRGQDAVCPPPHPHQAVWWFSKGGHAKATIAQYDFFMRQDGSRAEISNKKAFGPAALGCDEHRVNRE